MRQQERADDERTRRIGSGKREGGSAWRCEKKRVTVRQRRAEARRNHPAPQVVGCQSLRWSNRPQDLEAEGLGLDAYLGQPDDAVVGVGHPTLMVVRGDMGMNDRAMSRICLMQMFGGQLIGNG